MVNWSKIWSMLRLVYGAFFAAMGVLVFLKITPMDLGAPYALTPAQGQFMLALRATGFMDPLLGVSYLGGGLALLTRRTCPLGVILLAPPVLVILLFHAVLSSNPWIGVVVATLLAIIAWGVRDAFQPLWRGTSHEPV